MIILNGIPPIIGLGLMHVTVLNAIAILVETWLIGKVYQGRFLALRVILANVLSVLAGFIVVLCIPEAIGANVTRAESIYTSYDQFGMILGLLGLFICNVMIEFPAYVIGLRFDKSYYLLLFRRVLLANAVSNMPVFALYFLLVA